MSDEKIIESKGDIEIERRVHHVWNDMKQIENLYQPYRRPLPMVVGKYQYIVTNKKTNNKISIVELPEYFKKDGQVLWEIYCLEGKLFDDIMRFPTLAAAKRAAIHFLLTKDKDKK